MFTLIPEQYKKTIVREYHLRLATVGLALLFFGVMLAGAFLVPSFLLSQSKVQSVDANLSVFNKPDVAERNKALEKELVDTRNKLTILAPKTDKLFSHEIISKILYRKVAGVSLSAIVLNKSADGKGEARLSGVASNRDTLIAFSKALEKQEPFTEVVLPVSNFAKSRDIDFTLSVKGNF